MAVIEIRKETKTNKKMIVYSKDVQEQPPDIYPKFGKVGEVEEFCYLESKIAKDGRSKTENVQ